MANEMNAARGSCDYARARASGDRDAHIIQRRWERGALGGGIAFAVGFGLMFLWAGAMW